jgi:hypothetical protein
VSNTHMTEICFHVGAAIGAWLRPARLSWCAGTLALALASPGTAQPRELPQQGPAPSGLTLRKGDFITATASAEAAMTLRVVQPDGSVSRGTLERHQITSRRLGGPHRVAVYVSSGAACDRERCALLVLFDGPQHLSLVPTPSILDNLRADGRIPPFVAVFVSQEDRARELACNEDFGTFWLLN